MEEWWSKPVSLDGVIFEREEMEGYLQEAGFVIEVSMLGTLRRGRSSDAARLYPGAQTASGVKQSKELDMQGTTRRRWLRQVK